MCLLCNKSTLLAHIQLCGHQDPWVLFCKAAFQLVAPHNMYWCVGLFLCKDRNLRFSLLNFMRFLWAHLFSLLRSLWMAAGPSGASATPLSFVLSTDLLRVHSAPSSRSLMKMLTRSGPAVDPWGTQLVTGLQLDFVWLVTSLWDRPFSQF